MEATFTLAPEEACEAARAYLALRGTLPAHGKVLRVEAGSGDRYSGGSKITVTAEIGEQPAAVVQLTVTNSPDGSGA